MRGWRVAFRLAAREARHRKVRTLLVALLIALPVAGVVFGAGLARTVTPSPAEERSWYFGRADAVITATRGDADAEPVLRSLPPGTRTVQALGGRALFQAADGLSAEMDLRAYDLGDPTVAGIRDLVSGRVPATSDEIAVSASVLEASGLAVGDTLELVAPLRSVRITGVVRAPGSLGARVAVGVPDLVRGAAEVLPVLYVDVPGDAGIALGRVPGRDWHVDGAHDAEDARGHGVALATLIGGVSLVIAAIVASAALALAARRQLRQLGMLAGSGASPDQLRGIMTAAGTVVGLVGSVLGISVASLALVAIRPFVDGWAGHVTGGVDIAARDAAVALALGVGAATAAAWVPAFSSSRIPVLSAIAGRRPLGRIPRRVPVIGAVVAGAGVALMGAIAALEYGDDLWSFSLAGAVLVLLGATICSPWVVAAVEPVSRRLRGTARLALRSLHRQRTRAAAVVAAVMAAASLTMAGSTMILTDRANQPEADYSWVAPDQVLAIGFSTLFRGTAGLDAHAKIPASNEVLRDIERILPGAVWAQRERVTAPRIDKIGLGGEERTSDGGVALQPPGTAVAAAFAGVLPEGGPVTNYGDVSKATPALLAAIGAPAATAAALETADFVFFAPRSGRVVSGTLSYYPRNDGVERTHAVSIAVLGSDRKALWWTSVWSGRRAAELGIGSVFQDVLIRAPKALTDAQRDALGALAGRIERQELRAGFEGRLVESVYLQFATPVPGSAGPRVLFLALSLVFTLGVVALGVALAAADGRDERALLHALGASPASARRIAVVQSVALALLGGLLAAPIGFGPTATALSIGSDERVVFPWTTLVGLVAVVPLIVGLATSGALRVFGRRAPSAAVLADE